jgi:hypothetical protein
MEGEYTGEADDEDDEAVAAISRQRMAETGAEREARLERGRQRCREVV